MNKQPLLQWENIRGNFEDKNTSLLLGKEFSCVGEDKKINEILADPSNPPILKTDEFYQNIQQTLIQAVRDSHISQERIPINILNTVKEEISKYKNLFYTGYDLLIYWSLMLDEDRTSFRDFFLKEKESQENPIFDKKSDYSGDRLRVFYIHGALHLYSQGKEIRKIKYNKAIKENILDKFDKLCKEPDIKPLCIIEGSSTYKLNFIKSSEYLKFAYDELTQHTVGTNKLVVLANPLNFDKSLVDKTPYFNHHLLDAIVKSNVQQVAISIVNDEDVNQQMKYWEDVIEQNKIQFFEEESHPLYFPNI
ncbi:DUF4917 family protein [Microcoleus sp. w1-18aA5]|uniref:DUF4917 family protein n=1 Tax=Microcoleus sp. w1-18aA5 TaxID=2818982 RepID=UPI002FD284CF